MTPALLALLSVLACLAAAGAVCGVYLLFTE